MPKESMLASARKSRVFDRNRAICVAYHYTSLKLKQKHRFVRYIAILLLTAQSHTRLDIIIVIEREYTVQQVASNIVIRVAGEWCLPVQERRPS